MKSRCKLVLEKTSTCEETGTPNSRRTDSRYPWPAFRSSLASPPSSRLSRRLTGSFTGEALYLIGSFSKASNCARTEPPRKGTRAADSEKTRVERGLLRTTRVQQGSQSFACMALGGQARGVP